MKVNGNLNRILSMLERARVESNKINRLEPIENNKFVYSINAEGRCLCVICELNDEKMRKSNRVIGLKPIDKLDKEREEKKIVEKKLTKFDFLVVDNRVNEYPVILLEEDLEETKVNFAFLKNENKENISGLVIKPIFFKNKEKELILLIDEIQIKKGDIFSAQKICAGRKLLILKDGRKYIINSVIK
jgi:hypothetical protein